MWPNSRKSRAVASLTICRERILPDRRARRAQSLLRQAFAQVQGDCMSRTRRLPIGAELPGNESVHFRVWAPQRQRVEVVLEGSQTFRPLLSEGNGYHSRLIEGVGTGQRYRF